MTQHFAAPIRWLSISVVAFQLLLAAGCRPKVDVGQPKFLEEPQTAIVPGSSKGIGIEVRGADGTSLEYKWSSLRGTFHTGTTKVGSNIYRAPRDPGLDTITVEVIGGASPVQRTLQIEVTGQKADEDGERKSFAYMFDNNTMGWVPNKTAGAQGLVRVTHNPREHAGEGRGSLQLELDVDGRTEEKKSAEAEVNLTHAGDIVGEPVDMSNRTVVYYVRFPADFPIREDAPHGVQPFAKDDRHKSYYGCYRDVDVAGKWMKITFQLGPPVGLSCAADKTLWHQADGFNMARVTVIGFKIGANAGNRAYRGPVLLDDVRTLDGGKGQ